MSLKRSETFEQLASCYFDQTLDDAQRQRFAQMLRDDAGLVKRFAELAQLHQMIESEVTYQQQADRFGLSRSPNDSGSASALAELLGRHEDGLDEPIDFAAWRKEHGSQGPAGRRTAWRGRLIIAGSVAAFIAIAGLLAVVLDPPGTRDPLAADDPPDTAPRVVASWTGLDQAAFRDASGQPVTPAPGDTLASGQRLTLTEGFAELTTARGAIAVLQAPCEIELLDDDNALRLHAGKLLGVCETPSSKGFRVHTPHLDVVDLGTRFGVAIGASGGTLAEVFEGSIRLDQRAADNAGPVTIRVQPGEAVAFDSTGSRAEVQQSERGVFARLLGYASGLPTRGIARISGSVEWVERDRVIAGPDGRLPGSQRAWVCLELQDHLLTQALPTTAHEPGFYDELIAERFGSIPAGTRVRSYLIGFHPAGANRAAAKRLTSARGTVSFQGKILGVLANTPHWKRFEGDASANASGALLRTNVGMQIETQSKNSTGRDTFTIQPDGRTLDFYFEVSMGIDLIRVIVLEDGP